MKKFFAKELYIIFPFLFCVFVLSACVQPYKENTKNVFDGFSVNYIDSEDGNCTLIRFADGKNILIDSGKDSFYVKNKIDELLSEYSVDTLNAFILTGPFLHRISNAEHILKNYKVKNIFLPDLTEPDRYPLFKKFSESLKESETKIYYCNFGMNITGENYLLCFLAPFKNYLEGSLTVEEKSDEEESEWSCEDSPVIYLDYCGVRFLFVGDTTSDTESKIIRNYKAGIFSLVSIDGRRIKLENIDFYKTKNGDEAASSEDFVNLIAPKNALFSVGGSNGTTVSNKASKILSAANVNCKIYRTDAFGTVKVNVDGSGKVRIVTEYKKS